MFRFNREKKSSEYLYLIKTIDDNKIQMVSDVETVDGVVLSEGKLCAVLKRYTLPVDMQEVMADMQRFSGPTPAARPKPVAPKAKLAAPVKTSSPVSLAPKAALPVQKPKQEPPKMLRYLSDLKDPSSTAQGTRAAKTGEANHDAKLQAMGDAFFKDCERVLIDENGNTAENRLEAMRRLELYLESIIMTAHSRWSFSQWARCNPDGSCVSYEYAYTPGGRCYDGGCHSEEPGYSTYIEMYRITKERYDHVVEVAFDTRIDQCRGWWYSADIPFAAQTEVVYGFGKLFLKNPMGIAGYYEMGVSHRSDDCD